MKINETDKHYLQLLSQSFPTIADAAKEIINLEAIMNLPKGTEHFLADIHGESEAFQHVLKNASGNIKRKVNELFGNTIRESEKKELCTLIYYPEQKLEIIKAEEDMERLVAASKIANEGIDVDKEIEGLEKAKAELDDAISKMKGHKATLSGLLNKLYEAELKSNDLKQRNRNLFNACLTERNRKAKTKMLMEKMENEQKIQELDELVRSEKKKHFEDLGFLESLREGVDKCQVEYDRQVKEFKEKVGVNQDSIEQFVIKVYNKYQDDILEVD